MKKNYFLVGLAAVSLGIVAFQNQSQSMNEKLTSKSHYAFSGGGQAQLTGAPGEVNCTQCHSGTTLDGSSENDLSVLNAQFQPVTSYNPGEAYTVSLSLTSDPAKKGFSSTVLDGTNTMAGTVVGSGIGGTQDFTGGSRQYVSHTSSSNTDATTLWAWTWTAPATNVGDVTFYVASNVTNDNGATSGDMIYLSQHTLGSIASVDGPELEAQSFKAGYNASENKVVMDFTSLTSGEMHFNLVDMNGRSVYNQRLSKSLIGKNKQVVALPQEINNGMYIATLFVGNTPMSANIAVQK